jgi:hypothetical protein
VIIFYGDDFEALYQKTSLIVRISESDWATEWRLWLVEPGFNHGSFPEIPVANHDARFAVRLDTRRIAVEVDDTRAVHDDRCQAGW